MAAYSFNKAKGGTVITVQIEAFDPANNSIGISFSRYLAQKFASFDNVAGMFSSDANVTHMHSSAQTGVGLSSIHRQAGR
jgi:phage tail sheath protein FI